MIKPTVLIADNSKSSRKALSAFLNSHGFIPRLACSPEEALEILSRERIHALIVDIRLRNDADGNDFTGLDVVRASDPLIPRILRTGFPRETAEELIRQWPDIRPATFSFKKESLDVLLEKLKAVLDEARFDFGLDIVPAARFSFVSLAAEVEGPLLTSDLAALATAAGELEDLYRKLFSKKKAISVGWLPFGHRPEPFTLVQPEGEYGPQGALVVQCGRRAARPGAGPHAAPTIQDIRHNWQAYLEPLLHEHAAHLVDGAETPHYAGLVFRIDGPPDEFRPFSDHVRYALAPEHAQAPERTQAIVERVCQLWAAQKRDAASGRIDALCRREAGLDGMQDEFAAAFAGLIGRSTFLRPARKPGAFVLSLSAGRTVTLDDPAGALFEGTALYQTIQPQLSVSHGNLTGDTMLLGPQTQLWLVGSAHTGPGFYLRDFVSLEASLVLEALETFSADEMSQVLLALRAWLTPDRLTQTIQTPPPLSGALKNLLAVANTLRQNVWTSRDRPEIDSYYTGLLFCCARHVLAKAAPFRTHCHPAALATLLLADRLTRWPDWDPLCWYPVIRWIDRERRLIFVPARCKNEEEGIELLPQSADILDLFMSRPYQIVRGIEFTRGDPAQPIRRLREKIEPDPGSPCYIVTVEGVGYEFHPNGKDHP